MPKKPLLRIGLLLILLELCVIFKLSNEPAAQSDQTSGGFIETLLQTLDKDFPKKDAAAQTDAVQRLQKSIRTLAHLSEYLLLGLTTAAFAYTWKNKRLALPLGFAGCVLWAVSDEVHQWFIPGRSCQLSDIFVDSGGALLGTLLMALLCMGVTSWRSKRKDV